MIEFVITKWVVSLLLWVALPANFLYFCYAVYRICAATASESWEMLPHYTGIGVMALIAQVLVFILLFAIALTVDWLRT